MINRAGQCVEQKKQVTDRLVLCALCAVGGRGGGGIGGGSMAGTKRKQEEGAPEAAAREEEQEKGMDAQQQVKGKSNSKFWYSFASSIAIVVDAERCIGH